MPVHIFSVSACMIGCNVFKWLGKDTLSTDTKCPTPSPNYSPIWQCFWASSTDTTHPNLQFPGSQTCGWPFCLFFFAWIYDFVNFFLLFQQKYLTPAITYFEQTLLWLLTCSGEICGFRIHGQNVPFEAVVLDKSTGEGVIRAKDKLDCELQKEHTFTIQAYDCGEGPDGANMKKSHKWVMSLSTQCAFRGLKAFKITGFHHHSTNPYIP